MNELFEMLGNIARRRKVETGSPFASLKATEKWLKALPADSDYDAHHALVEGMERFNAENEVATLGRMQALLKLESVGLPLQHRIVDQYVRNQATFRLARQALWRETWVFWSLQADAWLGMLKQAYRGPHSADLKPHVAEMAVRALRYAALVMRWDYHQARNPAASGWCRLHKIYRLVERDGLERKEVMFNSRATHCAREYTLPMLMGLVQPVGYRAQEIESIAQIFEGYTPLPLPEKVPYVDVHTHMVDLSQDESAFVVEKGMGQGRRLRYFAFRPLIDYLKKLDASPDAESDQFFTRQIASLIERGGIRRNRQRTHRFGRVWVASGMPNILAALLGPGAVKHSPVLEPWMLRDESTDGLGFALPEEQVLPHGRLVAVSWDPAENVWQLLATRWNREEDGQNLVGTQRLSRHPKRVEIYSESQTAQSEQEKVWAVYLPMTHTEQSTSNLLIPQSHYKLGASLMLREDDVVYRLRLGEVQESHEEWLRVSMDVVGREQELAVAA
ncbi:hypothetical protein [Thiobacillus sp.]|uniref:hypothetical protein n=1 Tax=Thiobacillus sp. TaxID=924 RepID=UPI00286D8896|nr:hypothetical protein [Thiobacillus sp.]